MLRGLEPDRNLRHVSADGANDPILWGQRVNDGRGPVRLGLQQIRDRRKGWLLLPVAGAGTQHRSMWSVPVTRQACDTHGLACVPAVCSAACPHLPDSRQSMSSLRHKVSQGQSHGDAAATVPATAAGPICCVEWPRALPNLLRLRTSSWSGRMQSPLPVGCPAADAVGMAPCTTPCTTQFASAEPPC